MNDQSTDTGPLYVALYDAPALIRRSYSTVINWTSNVDGQEGTAPLETIRNPQDGRSLLVRVDDLARLYVERNRRGWATTTTTTSDGNVIAIVKPPK